MACCRRSVAVGETEGAEDPLKWGELGLGCSADCSGEREGRSAEKEKRSAAGGGIRSLQAEGEARRRRRGWRADRRCCWCSADAATDSEECGSVAAEAPVEARGEIGWLRRDRLAVVLLLPMEAVRPTVLVKENGVG